MTTAISLLPLMYEVKGIWRYKPLGKCLIEINVSADSTDPVLLTVYPDVGYRYLGVSYFRIFNPPLERSKIYISDWESPAKYPADGVCIADVDGNRYDVRVTPRDYGLDKIYCDKFWIQVIPTESVNYDRKTIIKFSGIEIR